MHNVVRGGVLFMCHPMRSRWNVLDSAHNELTCGLANAFLGHTVVILIITGKELSRCHGGKR